YSRAPPRHDAAHGRAPHDVGAAVQQALSGLESVLARRGQGLPRGLSDGAADAPRRAARLRQRGAARAHGLGRASGAARASALQDREGLLRAGRRRAERRRARGASPRRAPSRRADPARACRAGRRARMALASRSADPLPQARADVVARARDHRRPEPPGAPDDGRRRLADAAARPLVGRAVDARGARPRRVARRRGARVRPRNVEVPVTAASTGLFRPTYTRSDDRSRRSMKPPLVHRVVSQLTRRTMAVIMAGGRGQRLKQLTDNRAKPATPFGGKYRIIDFSLSNCVNSGIRQILVLTQYKAQSLIQHIGRGWGYLHGELGEFIDIVPAQQQRGEWWYRGTADAVYQNLDIIDQHRPETLLILAGDHVYKMDYGPLIAFHKESRADLTIGGVQVPTSEAREFGVMSVDPDHRVVAFDEKPAHPRSMPGREGIALASMGIYVVEPAFLREQLERDAERGGSRHDFGRDVIPEAIASARVFAYPFQDIETKAQAYWRDVGTVDAYY